MLKETTETYFYDDDDDDSVPCLSVPGCVGVVPPVSKTRAQRPEG